MSKTLKDCPFCGSKAKLDDCRTIWRVCCTNDSCEALVLGERAPEPDEETVDTIDWGYFESTAINRWNNRPMVSELPVNSEKKRFTETVFNSNPTPDHIGWTYESNGEWKEIEADFSKLLYPTK